MPVIQVPLLEAPAITPKRGTLLDVSPPKSGWAWQGSDDLYQTYNCLLMDAQTQLCPTPRQTKNLSAGPRTEDGVRFVIYGGLTCKTFGFDTQAARRVFDTQEAIGVEQALMLSRFRANGTAWAAATDLTPAAGAVKPKEAVAILEGHAAWNYAGVPTLHMPRVLASQMCGDFEWKGDMLTTPLGSKVAAGGGYDKTNTSPAGAAPAANEVWLYASGEVSLWASETQEQQAFNQSTNETVVLVERAWLAGIDCYSTAIRVRITT